MTETTRRELLPALALALAVLLVPGCARDEPPAEEAAPAEPAEVVVEDEESEVDVYTVRGEVVETTADGGLRVRHEAIDDMIGIDGQVWGMDAMTMDFEVADDVPLDGVEAGDKVELTLEVDWFGMPPQLVTALRELPAETELEFRAARPPAAEPDAVGADEPGS